MFNDLVLLHRERKVSSSASHSSVPEALSEQLKAASLEVPDLRESERGIFVWQTCLREIAILSRDLYETSEIQNLLRLGQIQTFMGEQAYEFCLQIISGLHSPLLGETEVLGQFKQAVGQWQLPFGPFGQNMKRFFAALFADVKTIRVKHLADLGSQSYGSLVRRELKNYKKIHFLGAGHLVQEMLPWLLKDEVEIHLHVRDVEKVKLELSHFAQIKIHAIQTVDSDLTESHALVIAAPLTSRQITEWLNGFGIRSLRTVDLRGESLNDPLGFSQVLSLHEMLALISANQENLRVKKNRALAEVKNLVHIRTNHVEYRPFGWEDAFV